MFRSRAYDQIQVGCQYLPQNLPPGQVTWPRSINFMTQLLFDLSTRGVKIASMTNLESGLRFAGIQLDHLKSDFKEFCIQILIQPSNVINLSVIVRTWFVSVINIVVNITASPQFFRVNQLVKKYFKCSDPHCIKFCIG